MRRAFRILAGLVPVLAVSCFLAAGVIGGGRAEAADPGLAKFLLKGGKDDLGRKQNDAAFSKFSRAEQEDPTLIEAVFWQATALDRKSELKGAVAAYRRFVAAVEAKARSGAATERFSSTLIRAPISTSSG